MDMVPVQQPYNRMGKVLLEACRTLLDIEQYLEQSDWLEAQVKSNGVVIDSPVDMGTAEVGHIVLGMWEFLGAGIHLGRQDVAVGHTFEGMSVVAIYFVLHIPLDKLVAGVAHTTVDILDWVLA